MSADDFRYEWERIEDEANASAARLIAGLAIAITVIWLGALAAYLPEFIHRM